jgi:hypothetical protein
LIPLPGSDAMAAPASTSSGPSDTSRCAASHGRTVKSVAGSNPIKNTFHAEQQEAPESDLRYTCGEVRSTKGSAAIFCSTAASM